MPDLRLGKYRSRQIMEEIVAVLRSAPEPISTAQIADKIGRDRSTAQRYLKDLERDDYVTMILDRGSRGRPRHLYQWRDKPSPPPARPNP
ncbi:HTH domain-containing protein [Frankia sp. CeD]|nr:HTH domain-containing protein [Frankia sp. CeD]